MGHAMMRRMRTSNRGLKLLMGFEGFRSRAISLGNDRFVVGYGHTKGAREGTVVSKSEAVAILQKYDLPPIEAFILDSATAPLNQNEFDALVSLVFNIGIEAFRTSDVLAFLNSGEKLAAGEAFTAWRKARLNGRLIIIDALIRRRAAEKALFMLHPGGTPIAPSAHIRPVIDEKAARFIPSEPPIVATRERRPVDDAVLTDEDREYVPADDGQTELEFGNEAAPLPVPGSDAAPDAELAALSALDDLPPLEEVAMDDVPVGAQKAQVDGSVERTAPELAAGALVARLTRILGEPGSDSEAPTQASEVPSSPPSPSETDIAPIKEGPTPDEITRAISELAENTVPVAEDLPPLPEMILTGEDKLSEEDVARIEPPKAVMIDDLEPLPEAALQRPQAVAGVNGTEPKQARAGMSWLIYVLLGLVGASLAAFGVIGPSTDLVDANRGIGQFGYIGLTVLGGLLMLLAAYFLIKAYRSRR